MAILPHGGVLNLGISAFEAYLAGLHDRYHILGVKTATELS